jgi:predicted methyltransferase
MITWSSNRKWLAGAAAAALLTGCATTAPVRPLSAAAFAAAVADAARPEADTVRDADRRPAEVMAFAGVRPGMKIGELAPGGGYFTRLLSMAVGPAGRVYALSSRPAPALEQWAATHPNVTVKVGPLAAPLAPEPLDMVWTTLNYHDFKNAKVGDSDNAQLTNRMAFAALKPGGIYLVGDHEAAAGSGASASNTLHRIESALVIREVEAAGFKLVSSGDVLRHREDNHTARVMETGIRGKTDQFLLRFRKPG